MSTGALIMMIGWQGFITFMMLYFFIRVLRSKPKPGKEEDASSGPDETKSRE
jgi:hypothetical protein